MRKDYLFLIVLFVFLVIYNIFIFNTLNKKKNKEPAPRKEEVKKEEVVKTEIPVFTMDTLNPVIVESDLYKVYIDPSRGVIYRINLKNYRSDGKPDVDILNSPVFLFSEDTIPLYNYKGEKHIFLNDNESRVLTFSGKDQRSKDYRFYGNTYKFDYASDNYGNFLVYFMKPVDEKEDIKENLLLIYEKGKTKKFDRKKLNEYNFSKDLYWITSKSTYFTFSIIYSGDSKPLSIKKVNEYYYLLNFKNNKISFESYTGPIDYFLLKEIGYGMEGVYPAGWSIMKPFTIGILYIFRTSAKFIKNYGLLIIIFSLLMKIVFMPLSLKSLKSMQKLSQLQPRLKALQKVYKDDPKKLQEETFKLYRQMGVNPFSGCLPLLFQLPIFWGLYQVLRYDIMFRKAPFMLWITDLSLKDPYYILPVLMGITSIAQQFLQPAQEKQTRNIGFFMAAFITIIFLNFPAGLVLYWFVYNLWGIVETLILKKIGIKK